MSDTTETPLLDLLKSVPADARMVYEHSPIESSSIPVGVLAKRAADEIERLRAAVLGHETNCMTKAREIEALRNSLDECVEDSEEVLATHLQAYGEKYRVQRADFLRAQISTARALLAGKAVTP